MRKLSCALVIILSAGLMGQAQQCRQGSAEIEKLFDVTPDRREIHVATFPAVEVGPTGLIPSDSSQVAIALDVFADSFARLVAAREPALKINDPSRSLPTSEESQRRLYAITVDRSLSREAKIDRMIDELLVPKAVDGLGWTYFERISPDEVVVRFLLLSRPTRKLLSPTHRFPKRMFACADADNASRTVFCQLGQEQLRDMLLAQCLDLDCPGEPGVAGDPRGASDVGTERLHVATLVIDELSGIADPDVSAGLMALVKRVTSTVARQRPIYVFDEPGHTFPDATAAGARLSAVFWDVHMTATEKRNILKAELLLPNKIDRLLWVQPQKVEGERVRLRMGYFNAEENALMTEAVALPLNDLRCEAPAEESQKKLCSATEAKLLDQFRELRRQAEPPRIFSEELNWGDFWKRR